LLFLAGFVSYVLRYNISAAGPALMMDLEFTEQQLGYVFAAFTAGYAIFQLPGGLFSDRLGPRRALAICTVLWGALTLLTAIVPDDAVVGTTAALVLLIVIRFLVGVVHAPMFPILGSAVERWFPPGSWALPNGLSSTGLTLGTAAAAPLIAWLVVTFGWRTAFVVLAPLPLIIAAVWWKYARDYPAEHPAVNRAEVDLIARGREALEVVGTDDARPSWQRVLANRDVLLLTISYFCMNYVFYMFFNWVFYYLVTVRGFAEQQAGFLTAAQWVAAAVGAALGGYICDLLCRRYGIRRGCAWPGIVGVGISGVLLFAGSVIDSGYLAVACLAFSFLFNQLTEGAYWAAAIGIGGRHTAAACGVMNTGGNVVGFVNALLVPLIAGTLGWTAAMTTGAVFAFVGASLWLFIRADRRMAD
jgi:ACS family glucarate transporter-like MFS transporter